MSRIVRYFLPKSGWRSLRHYHARGLRRQKEVFEYDGFKVPGTLISGSRSKVMRFIEGEKMTIGRLGTVAGASVHVLVDEFMPSSILSPEKDHGLAKHERFGAALQDTCSLLSEIAGLEVTLHAVDSVSFSPKIVRGDIGYQSGYTFSVVLGASPPGSHRLLVGSKACGVDFYEDGTNAEFPGPARGRGIYVEDEEKHLVAQIVGETAYLFVPSKSETALSVLTSRGDLFKKVLRLAWNAFAEGRSFKGATGLADASALLKVLTKLEAEFPERLEKEIQDIDREIGRLRKRYSHLMNQRKYFTHVKDSLARRTYYGTPEEHRRMWDDLCAIPEVAQKEWREDAFQLITHPIVHEFEGKRYDLGEFGIRLEPDGRISVWSEMPTHPRQIAHPHINEQGTVCFGNIDFELRDLMAEGRIPAAAALVVHWLKDGYDPEIADTKIEQWPLEGDDNDRTNRKLRTSAKTVRPATRKTHRRVRSGRSR